jgi:hypothetical protein
VRNHDWDTVVAARSNVLIEGDRADTERFVSELTPHLHGPVVSFPQSASIEDDEGVVLVADVDRLDGAGQRTLMAVIERGNGRLQIICTSTTPLFDRVERGDFLSALYYRLNTIWIGLPRVGGA